MMTIKSSREMTLIARSARITADVLGRLAAMAAPGITTRQLDQAAEKWIHAAGGVTTFKGYRGFPASLCVSINEEVVHGIPGDRVLRDGDILSLDLGVTLDGYVSDSALTIPIGTISDEAERLRRVTQESLLRGIAQMYPGKRIGDIGAAVQGCAEAEGFGVVRELVGHGIGRQLHEEPQVPNHGKPGTGLLLRVGMVLAVEPMLTLGSYAVETLDDDWTVVTEDRSLSAHFEHTIAITEDGPKILTWRDVWEHPETTSYLPPEAFA